MADLATITLTGRLGRDPEVKNVGDNSVTSFSLAVSGFKKDDVSWFNCEAWGKVGEIIAQYCSKGKQVGVGGTIKIDNWTDKDGNNRQTPKVNVREMTLLGSADESKQAQKQEVKSDDIPF
jgi:single-strand DNA-binding protein